MTSKKHKKGAITIIFLIIMAMVMTLILAMTQSQLLLSLRRSQSVGDIILATYEAESVVNDIMARIIKGYIPNANISQTITLDDGTRIKIEGSEVGKTQTVTVTAYRAFAVGKVQAVRRLQSFEELQEIDMVLALDCTGSMDAADADPACTSNCRTRMEAQTEAAVGFVGAVSNLSEADKIRLGIIVFGTDSKWLRVGSTDLSPNSGVSHQQVLDVLQSSFGRTRNQSPACLTVMNGTSIGSAFLQMNDYFFDNKKADTKQIGILITDGVPNSRIPESRCPPSEFCPILSGLCNSNPYGWTCANLSGGCTTRGENFLRCTLADNTTFVPEIGQYGLRDPEVDMYAVTVLDNPPARVVNIFRNYTTENGYYNATRAGQLSGILDALLKQIKDEVSNITIRRVIPLPE